MYYITNPKEYTNRNKILIKTPLLRLPRVYCTKKIFLNYEYIKSSCMLIR